MNRRVGSPPVHRKGDDSVKAHNRKDQCGYSDNPKENAEGAFGHEGVVQDVFQLGHLIEGEIRTQARSLSE